MDADASAKTRRLCAGDAIHLQRECGDAMKGVVVAADAFGIDVVVDGPILEGEVLAVSRSVHDDARYTAVMEVVDTGPGRSRVRLMGDWKRQQMREFVRVAVGDLPIEVRGEAAVAPGPARRRAGAAGPPRLVDLSAGGLRFESHERYRMGATLEIAFSLPRFGPLSVRGEVVRMAESGERCQYGIRFEGLEEPARVRLMTWVFAELARRFRTEKRDAAG